MDVAAPSNSGRARSRALFSTSLMEHNTASAVNGSDHM
jgi:hypothetical protein